MRIVISAILLTILIVTGLSVHLFHGKRIDIAVAILGSFWGFFLSQAGLMTYERSKQKEELISMMVSAKNELLMNKATIGWIKQLLLDGRTEREVDSYGFSNVDEISVKAIENLIDRPLIYKFTSKEFSSKKALSIYQTILRYKKEIPTEDAGNPFNPKYGDIKFDGIIKSFDILINYLDSEGSQLCGGQEWIDLTQGQIETCPLCKSIIDSSANYCKNCGAETTEQRRKIATYSALIISIILLTVLGITLFLQKV